MQNKLFIGGFISLFSYWLGGIDKALEVLIFMVVVDYLTGVFVAISQKCLNSKVGFKGIFKKFSMFIIVGVAVQLDLLFGQQNILRTIAIYFFIANEGFSLIENMGNLNIVVPEFLKEYFTQLQDRKWFHGTKNNVFNSNVVHYLCNVYTKRTGNIKTLSWNTSGKEVVNYEW